MKTVYLSLGSNLGDRANYLKQAVAALVSLEETKLMQVSQMYETPPWGKTDQPDFLNLALSLETNLSPERLLQEIAVIENTLGRQRMEHWGPRTIDIDILVYEGETRNTQKLSLPHPNMHERLFVLEPLSEIAPNLDIKGKTVSQWKNSLNGKP